MTLPKCMAWSDGERAVVELWVARLEVGLSMSAVARRLHSTIMAHRSIGAIVQQLHRTRFP